MSDGRRVDWGSRSRWEVHRGVYFGANGGLIRGLIFSAHIALGLLHRALAAVANVIAGGAREFAGFVEGAAGLVGESAGAVADALGDGREGFSRRFERGAGGVGDGLAAFGAGVGVEEVHQGLADGRAAEGADADFHKVSGGEQGTVLLGIIGV